MNESLLRLESCAYVVRAKINEKKNTDNALSNEFIDTQKYNCRIEICEIPRRGKQNDCSCFIVYRICTFVILSWNGRLLLFLCISQSCGYKRQNILIQVNRHLLRCLKIVWPMNDIMNTATNVRRKKTYENKNTKGEDKSTMPLVS